jgi:hypothetical protein
LPALVADLVRYVTRGEGPVDAAMGYADVPLAAAVGLARAWQVGGDFFGLRVARPFSTPRALARRPGATPRPLKVLWLTVEGPSFGATAKCFGIAPGLVTVLQRQDVAATEWPEIVKLVRREAWRRGCAYVIVDTVRAWCPQTEQSNDRAAAVLNLARKELAAPGLGVLFVHHDRKGGGGFGEGVAGPNNLVGSTWGNRLVLLDGSKGILATDADADGTVQRDAAGGPRVRPRLA